MFRKILNISLVLVILFSSTGITISKHYCHNRLVKIAIYKEAKSCCRDGMGKCCRNETSLFQLKEDFLKTTPKIQFENSVVINLHLLVNMLFNINNIDIAENICNSAFESPPPDTGVHLCQLQTYRL
jgi:hypothetical protein